MMMHKRLLKRIAVALPLAVSLAIPGGAAAHANYPERPIRLVVPFGAGGGTDVLGRMIAERMSEGLGQAVVVENKPGAGGSIGASDVAKAAPDGYTVLMATNSTHSINPALYSSLVYDPIKDFSPIGIVATAQFVAAVPAALPATNLKEFLAIVNEEPNKHNYGSSGNGTTSHLSGALFTHLTGAPIEHVPYKSNGPALTDLIAGRVSLMFDNIVAMQANMEAGRIRPIATTGDERSPILAEVPTLKEQGLTDYHISGWFGMLAPAGTPEPVVQKLSKELTRVLQLPEVSDRMVSLGVEPKVNTPEEFAQMMQADVVHWQKIVDLAGAKLD